MSDSRYGASPDALCSGRMLLEVKTRGINNIGPIESLNAFPHYFVQCQL